MKQMSVIAYIEAKNTVVREEGQNNSLERAIEQAVAPKLLTRESVPLTQIFNYPFATADKISVTMNRKFPQILNPLFTAVFTRGVREKEGSDLSSTNHVIEMLLHHGLYKRAYAPDLLVLGSDIVLYPHINEVYYSPFYISNLSSYAYSSVNGLAYGIAIALMLSAFERIRLGEINWIDVVKGSTGWRENSE